MLLLYDDGGGRVSIYQYRQNNSGGSFVYDDPNGISEEVYIQADNPTMADEYAMTLGIYFDGVASGRDCPCCGDRWQRAYEAEIELYFVRDYWRSDGPGAYLHLSDGTFIPIITDYQQSLEGRDGE